MKEIFRFILIVFYFNKNLSSTFKYLFQCSNTKYISIALTIASSFLKSWKNSLQNISYMPRSFSIIFFHLCSFSLQRVSCFHSDQYTFFFILVILVSEQSVHLVFNCSHPHTLAVIPFSTADTLIPSGQLPDRQQLIASAIRYR